MAGAAGSIMDMIQKMRQNRELLRKKGLYHKEHGFLHLKKEDYKSAKGQLKSKKASPALLRNIRIAAQQRQRKERHIGLLITVVVFGLLGYWGYTLFKTEHVPVSADYLMAETQKSNDYVFYISDGDTWYTKGKWHNAAFQYKKALDLFPYDYDTMLRLCLAYAHQCDSESNNCDKANALLKQLQSMKPWAQELRPIILLLDANKTS